MGFVGSNLFYMLDGVAKILLLGHGPGISASRVSWGGIVYVDVMYERSHELIYEFRQARD